MHPKKKNWYESSMTTFCKRFYNFTSDIGLIVGVVVSAVLALALCVGITMLCRKHYECLYCQRNQRTEAAGTIPQNRVVNIKNNDDGRVPQYCHQYFRKSATAIASFLSTIFRPTFSLCFSFPRAPSAFCTHDAFKLTKQISF